jgi:hypothetical protein
MSVSPRIPMAVATLHRKPFISEAAGDVCFLRASSEFLKLFASENPCHASMISGMDYK